MDSNVLFNKNEGKNVSLRLSSREMTKNYRARHQEMYVCADSCTRALISDSSGDDGIFKF